MTHYYRSGSKSRRIIGGIKAHTRRGEIGRSWWSRHWMDIAEELAYKEKFSRGKMNARQGRVVSLNLGVGKATATAYGIDDGPYDLEITMMTPDAGERKAFAAALAARPRAIADLLAGTMSEEIEEVFYDANIPAYPREWSVDVTCACPEGRSFCRHGVAAAVLLAEEFDRDPFLALEFRGMERERLLKAAGVGGTGRARGGLRPLRRLFRMIERGGSESRPSKPLPADPVEFWGGEEDAPYDPGEAAVPEEDAALPKQLGDFPLWRSWIRFMPRMEEAYANASRAGLEMCRGDLEGGAGPPAKRRRGRPRKDPS